MTFVYLRFFQWLNKNKKHCTALLFWLPSSLCPLGSTRSTWSSGTYWSSWTCCTSWLHIHKMIIRDILHMMKCIVTLTNVFFREVMVNQVLVDSRVCLDRREMKDPEASLDLLVPSVCRWVPLCQWRPKYELTFVFCVALSPRSPGNSD